MPSNKIKEILLKFKALSEKGDGGEKTTATEMLNKALKKHGLTLEDLEKEEREPRVFKIKNREDSLTILFQCIKDVREDSKVDFSTRTLQAYCDLNASDYIEVCEKYKHYYNIWLKEKKQFLTAYILRNEIGLSSKPSEGKIDEEEKMAIIKKMGTIEDNKFIDKNLKMLN